MIDSLLQSLHDVSLLLIPFVGLLCLVFLAIFLYRLMVLGKSFPATVDRVNKAIDNVDSTISTTNGLVKKMNEPINTIVGVSKTVDKVNGAANGIASSVASYAIKNSDAVVNWSKNFFAEKKEAKKERNAEKDVNDSLNDQEEDFGVYE